MSTPASTADYDDDGGDEPEPPPLHVDVSFAIESPDQSLAARPSPDADAEPQQLCDALAEALTDACRRLHIDRAQLSVVIVDDPHMTRLHEQFLKVPTTTDVLTFDLRDAPGDADQPIEGEIYICYDEARRRVAELKHPISHELLLYALHGLLHLLGYDDHDEQGWKLMHRIEDQLLEELGVGRVFGIDRAAAGPSESGGEGDGGDGGGE